MEKSGAAESPLVMQIVVPQSAVGAVEPNKFFVLAESSASMLGAMSTKSLAGVCSSEALSESLLTDAEFWRLMFSALREDSTISLVVGSDSKTDSIVSLAKMSGFTNVNIANGAVFAQKAKFQAGGTSIRSRKTKKEADANPWAGLTSGAQDSEMINEEDLMKEGEAKVDKVTEQFCGDGDRIMPGKPCENCTCGKKELMEGTITEAQLESGQVESSCGKCYLGDAFRCASCPFLGKPAFEAGDKVKLQNASVAQDTGVKAEQVKTAANQSSTKVVLEL